MKSIIKFKGFTIQRWVAAIVHDPDFRILGEYDSLSDAKRIWGKHLGVTLKFAAAEWINKDGDLNPAVYGDSLQQVTDKIKKLLCGTDH